MESKVCKRCLSDLPLLDFYKNKNGIKGVNTYCIACSKAASKKSHYDNRDKIIAKQKDYRLKNRDYFNKKNKDWREKTGYGTKYVTDRLKTDLIFRMKFRIRGLVKNSFKNRINGVSGGKPKKTELLLGCSLEQLIEHLRVQFKEGMTLENHGQWHIDHRIPLSSAKTEKELINLCHYTNLQPLWAIDNLKKYNKINNETFEKP